MVNSSKVFDAKYASAAAYKGAAASVEAWYINDVAAAESVYFCSIEASAVADSKDSVDFFSL